MALSSLALKWLAVLTMLLDHVGYSLALYLPPALTAAMRMTGRLAMPIFCFLIAEGYFHTRDAKRYMARLFVFALLSEIPFDLLATNGRVLLAFDAQNVFFTLGIALMAIRLYDGFEARGQSVASLLSLLGCGALAMMLRTDYGVFGVLYVFVFYRFRGQKALRSVFFVVATGIMAWAYYPDWGLSAALAAFACAPIWFYNGTKGYEGRFLQIAFYAFYPMHILILVIIRMWLGAR